MAPPLRILAFVENSFVLSLYSSVTSCVRINNLQINLFDVDCGLRQRCILSPVLFNLYINALALYLKSYHRGIKCNDDNICIFMYAVDIVLLKRNKTSKFYYMHCLIGVRPMG